MTGKAMLLNKQIWLALGMIVFVGAVVASGTGAFFSDTTQVTGNTFAAGTLELDMTQAQGGGTPTDTLSGIWDFSNMAPGGTPETASIWFRNSGSIDGATLGINIAAGWSDPSNVAAQMRINEMTLAGSNILEGGAGASIPEYEAPANCTTTVGGSDTITGAIAAAASGDVICVTGANYDATWEGSSTITVDEEVTLVTVGGPGATKVIPFLVTADNVTIKGFEISDPSGRYGVSITSGASNVTVTHNEIRDLATSLSSGSVQAISVQNGATGGSGYVFADNVIEDIGNLNLVFAGSGGRSAKGIYLGDTTASALDDITIQNNIITNIQAGIAAWNAGRGAYGILTNVAGGVTNLVIENNTITNLEGLWSHAIGLEGDTDGAIVRLNTISDLVDHKGGSDAAGVQFESNSFASTVTVSENNLTPNVAQGVRNVTALPVTAQNNWWGDFDPSDQILEDSGSVDTTNFAGGPFAGLVNGVDTNGNSFADLDDLQQDPITDITPGLDAYDGTNDKEFVMSVQLDGPTTDNTFQGAVLDNVGVEFTLNQI